MDEEGDKKHDAMQNMASRPQSLQDYLSDQLAFLDADARAGQAGPLRHRPHRRQRLPERAGRNRPGVSHRRRCPTLEELAASLSSHARDAGAGRGGAAHRPEARPARRRRPRPRRMPAAAADAGDAAPRHAARADPEPPGRHRPQPPAGHPAAHRLRPARHQGSHRGAAPPQPAARARSSPPRTFPTSCRTSSSSAPRTASTRCACSTTGCRTSTSAAATSSCTRRRAADPKTKEYLKRKIQAAQWLQESIEQRRSTLEKVTRAIIQHQRAFLDKGPEHIEPLKMQQIADQVGVHVTTVSRAVDDKWVQTPRGIFPLKRFFGGGTHNGQRRGSGLGDDQAEAAGDHRQGGQVQPALRRGPGDQAAARPATRSPAAR